LRRYYRDHGKRSGRALLGNLVAPLIGFGLTVWLWTSLSGMTMAVGLIWLALGFAWLLFVTRGFRRPTPILELDQ